MSSEVSTLGAADRVLLGGYSQGLACCTLHGCFQTFPSCNLPQLATTCHLLFPMSYHLFPFLYQLCVHFNPIFQTCCHADALNPQRRRMHQLGCWPGPTLRHWSDHLPAWDAHEANEAWTWRLAINNAEQHLFTLHPIYVLHFWTAK